MAGERSLAARAASAPTGMVGPAVASMCAGVFCLVVNDTFAKWLTAGYEPLQIVFLRNLFALPMVTALALALGGRAALRTAHLRLHALRGVLLVAAPITFFLGLRKLPLAEATVLIFAAPIFITALSVPLLGDRVGWRRWTAVLAGFAGVLVIVQPGAAAFQPASLYPVSTAVLYALIMISTRWIHRSESMWTMMVFVVLFPLLYSALIVPTVWRTPALEELPLFVGIAVFGVSGMTLISQSFRLAAAAIVAPFDYTALVWASLFGWLVFGEVPGAWIYAGAAVIVASGVYIFVRERRLAGAA